MCKQVNISTYSSVEDGKPETYLPSERQWSGYVSFPSIQDRFRHIFHYFNLSLPKYWTTTDISQYFTIFYWYITHFLSSKVFDKSVVVLIYMQVKAHVRVWKLIHVLWREAVAGIVFSDVPISNCMNYATYCLIRFTIGVFYNIYTPFQQFGVLISLILP